MKSICQDVAILLMHRGFKNSKNSFVEIDVSEEFNQSVKHYFLE